MRAIEVDKFMRLSAREYCRGRTVWAGAGGEYPGTIHLHNERKRFDLLMGDTASESSSNTIRKLLHETGYGAFTGIISPVWWGEFDSAVTSSK